MECCIDIDQLSVAHDADTTPLRSVVVMKLIPIARKPVNQPNRPGAMKLALSARRGEPPEAINAAGSAPFDVSDENHAWAMMSQAHRSGLISPGGAEPMPETGQKQARKVKVRVQTGNRV